MWLEFELTRDLTSGRLFMGSTCEGDGFKIGGSLLFLGNYTRLGYSLVTNWKIGSSAGVTVLLTHFQFCEKTA